MSQSTVTEKRTVITSSSSSGSAGFDSLDDIPYKANMGSRSNIMNRSSLPLRHSTGGGSTMVRTVEYGYGSSMGHGGYANVSNTGVSSVKETREKEKKDMQDLNERFASYIEKVRFLEAQNRKLGAELDELRSKWGKETSHIKQMYEAELSEARRLIDDLSKDKAAFEIKYTSIQEQNGDLNRQLDEAKKYRQQDREVINKLNQQIADLESEVNLLRRSIDSLETERGRDKATINRLQQEVDKLRIDLNNETLAHLDAENRRQTLEEEMEFMKKVHEQELKELAALAYRDTTAENREFWKSELAQCIRDIQQEYDNKVDQIRGDMEGFYNLKIQEFRTGATKQNMEVTHIREENKKLSKQMSDLRSKLADMEARNAQLEKQYQDCLRELEKKDMDHVMETTQLREEISKLRLEMENILAELQTIVDIKLSLELEIAAYRKLLEGEENRVEAARRRFDLIYRDAYPPYERKSTEYDKPSKDKEKPLESVKETKTEEIALEALPNQQDASPDTDAASSITMSDQAMSPKGDVEPSDFAEIGDKEDELPTDEMQIAAKEEETTIQLPSPQEEHVLPVKTAVEKLESHLRDEHDGHGLGAKSLSLSPSAKESEKTQDERDMTTAITPVLSPVSDKTELQKQSSHESKDETEINENITKKNVSLVESSEVIDVVDGSETDSKEPESGDVTHDDNNANKALSYTETTNEPPISDDTGISNLEEESNGDNSKTEHMKTETDVAETGENKVSAEESKLEPSERLSTKLDSPVKDTPEFSKETEVPSKETVLPDISESILPKESTQSNKPECVSPSQLDLESIIKADPKKDKTPDISPKITSPKASSQLELADDTISPTRQELVETDASHEETQTKPMHRSDNMDESTTDIKADMKEPEHDSFTVKSLSPGVDKASESQPSAVLITEADMDRKDYDTSEVKDDEHNMPEEESMPEECSSEDKPTAQEDVLKADSALDMSVETKSTSPATEQVDVKEAESVQTVKTPSPVKEQTDSAVISKSPSPAKDAASPILDAFSEVTTDRKSLEIESKRETALKTPSPVIEQTASKKTEILSDKDSQVMSSGNEQDLVLETKPESDQSTKTPSPIKEKDTIAESEDESKQTPKPTTPSKEEDSVLIKENESDRASKTLSPEKEQEVLSVTNPETRLLSKTPSPLKESFPVTELEKESEPAPTTISPSSEQEHILVKETESDQMSKTQSPEKEQVPLSITKPESDHTSKTPSPGKEHVLATELEKESEQAPKTSSPSNEKDSVLVKEKESDKMSKTTSPEKETAPPSVTKPESDHTSTTHSPVKEHRPVAELEKESEQAPKTTSPSNEQDPVLVKEIESDQVSKTQSPENEQAPLSITKPESDHTFKTPSPVKEHTPVAELEKECEQATKTTSPSNEQDPVLVKEKESDQVSKTQSPENEQAPLSVTKSESDHTFKTPSPDKEHVPVTELEKESEHEPKTTSPSNEQDPVLEKESEKVSKTPSPEKEQSPLSVTKLESDHSTKSPSPVTEHAHVAIEEKTSDQVSKPTSPKGEQLPFTEKEKQDGQAEETMIGKTEPPAKAQEDSLVTHSDLTSKTPSPTKEHETAQLSKIETDIPLQTPSPATEEPTVPTVDLAADKTPQPPLQASEEDERSPKSEYPLADISPEKSLTDQKDNTETDTSETDGKTLSDEKEQTQTTESKEIIEIAQLAQKSNESAIKSELDEPEHDSKALYEETVSRQTDVNTDKDNIIEGKFEETADEKTMSPIKAKEQIHLETHEDDSSSTSPKTEIPSLIMDPDVSKDIAVEEESKGIVSGSKLHLDDTENEKRKSPDKNIDITLASTEDTLKTEDRVDIQPVSTEETEKTVPETSTYIDSNDVVNDSDIKSELSKETSKSISDASENESALNLDLNTTTHVEKTEDKVLEKVVKSEIIEKTSQESSATVELSPTKELPDSLPTFDEATKPSSPTKTHLEEPELPENKTTHTQSLTNDAIEDDKTPDDEKVEQSRKIVEEIPTTSPSRSGEISSPKQDSKDDLSDIDDSENVGPNNKESEKDILKSVSDFESETVDKIVEVTDGSQDQNVQNGEEKSFTSGNTGSVSVTASVVPESPVNVSETVSKSSTMETNVSKVSESRLASSEAILNGDSQETKHENGVSGDLSPEPVQASDDKSNASIEKILLSDDSTVSMKMMRGEVSAKTTYQRTSTGPIAISEVSPEGKFIMLENTSSGPNRRDVNLDGWRLKRTVDGKRDYVYNFRNFTLKAGKKVKILARGSASEAGLNDLVFRDEDNWGVGSQVTTSLINEKDEEKASHIQKTLYN